MRAWLPSDTGATDAWLDALSCDGRRVLSAGQLAARWQLTPCALRDVPRHQLPYLEIGPWRRRHYLCDHVEEFERRRVGAALGSASGTASVRPLDALRLVLMALVLAAGCALPAVAGWLFQD